MTDEAAVPVLSAADRSWRLPVCWRVSFVAFQALVPLLVLVLTTAAPGSSPGPVSWGVVAAAAATWLPLARRTWGESVTLTSGTLVIRNAFTTRRVPLTQVTAVHVTLSGLRITARVNASGPATGRHDGGRALNVGAVRIGGAYWTGRRTGADEIADAVAAAAGLRPLPPRKQQIAPGMAWFMLIVGLAIAGLGMLLNVLFGSSTGLLHQVSLAGSAMVFPAALFVLPAAAALIDDRRHPEPPAPAAMRNSLDLP